MMKEPHTNAEYAEALAICRSVKRGDKFRHLKNGSLVQVRSVYAAGFYPFISLQLISARPGRQNYTIRALNFPKLYKAVA